jgi:anaerobic magnesium-protoporphyrin IX monomethyl ester cyclase
MTDILLIQPPIRDFYLTAKRTIPYGLACIAGTLIEQGFDVEILDALAVSKSRILPKPEKMARLEPYYGTADISPFALFHHFRHYGYSYEHIENRIKASGAFLVGISSLFTAYCEESLETARIVKKANPGCRVVLGGHHPTACPEDVLRHEAVDFIIRGEGEVAMPFLAKALENGTSIKELSGIGYKTGPGKYHINPSVYMDRPDDFPLPADHLINHRYYRRKKGRSIVITAGRGCPMQCSYCCVGSTSELPYRKRSVAAVIGEITRALRQENLGFVDFEDENLSMDRTWFLDLLGEIQTRFKTSALELRAMNGLYPPSLDETVIAAMKAAGFSTLNLSLCSTHTQQLKRFLRPDVTRAFSDALDWAEKYGLDAVGYIIAGAPHQTPGASLGDLLFLAGQRVLAGLSIYYPAPGSRDFDTCRELGVLPDDYALMRSCALPISHTTRRIESVTLLRLSRILNFMKRLIDGGEKIPDPAPFEDGAIPSMDSGNPGLTLLSWFLYDGKIRGVTREGVVYEHRISRELARDFIDGIKTVRVRGTLI